MSPRIELRRAPPTQIHYLARPIAGAPLSNFLASLGVGALPPPGRSASSAAQSILGISRERWWLVSEEPARSSATSSAAAASFGIVVDIGDAWERFRISGEAVLELLSKGSALDLDARVFANGHCAPAAFAELHTLLNRGPDGEYFDLYCGRSYGETLHEWLAEAAAEFGPVGPFAKGGAGAGARTR
jgi:heterotetrameric sarcosine oxidase gamma subunit